MTNETNPLEKKHSDIPAFPLNMSPGVKEMYQGMTLRDYFAAKAMQAYITRGAYVDIAESSYFIADKMLVERLK